jgi:hypothetical protein
MEKSCSRSIADSSVVIMAISRIAWLGVASSVTLIPSGTTIGSCAAKCQNNVPAAFQADDGALHAHPTATLPCQMPLDTPGPPNVHLRK